MKNILTKIYFLIAFLLIWEYSCVFRKEAQVTITKDYVINPYWDKIDNSFMICKMIKRDTAMSLDISKISSQNLLRNLLEDTSSSFITNVSFNGEDYSKRKVYFNRYNGFSWGSLNNRYSNTEQNIFGDLKYDTWYLLKGLGIEKTLYYIYLDTADSLHIYKVPASDWTNY